jgi:hypothetical protein
MEGYCKECGSELVWEDCPAIGCEDGWIDVYEDDPLWYDPGDEEVCEECNGKGGWLRCPDCVAE